MKRTGLFPKGKELKTDGNTRRLTNTHLTRSRLEPGSAYSHYSTSFKVLVRRLDRKRSGRPETELTSNKAINIIAVELARYHPRVHDDRTY